MKLLFCHDGDIFSQEFVLNEHRDHTFIANKGLSRERTS